MEMCVICGAFSASTDWAHVRSWTETVDRRTGRVIHSTYDEQLAMQGLIWCIAALCVFPGTAGCLSAAGGICWLLSAPGHWCGDGLVPPEEGDDRCLSALDFHDLLHNKPLCKPCTECVYKPPKTAAPIDL